MLSIRHMQKDHNGLCKPRRTNYSLLIKCYELFPNMGLDWKPPIYFAAMDIQFQNLSTNYLNVAEIEFY